MQPLSREGERTTSRERPVLVVDDEPSMRLALTESLQRIGYDVTEAADGREALVRLDQCKPWLVLTDMKMPRMSGLDVVKEIKKRAPGTLVVIMTAYGTIETAIEAMKNGASDYLLKPFATEQLEQVVTALETYPADRAWVTHAQAASSRPILTEDSALLRLLETAATVAACQATVLIHGESGTGKELLARFIHARSPRVHRPFVAVNCAALPDGLLESELFGHERGAFTGALGRKVGKFEMANHGTLLLDEISEMNLLLQAKLLRILQEREVDRVGGREPIPINIRIISTTNRSLRHEVEQGRFREDLYYRLNVFPITMPPLRERRGDIALLAKHFVAAAAQRNGQPTPTISDATLMLLDKRPWKGNVRELENVVERMLLLAAGQTIGPEHLPPEDPIARPGEVATAQPPGDPSAGSLWEMERDLIFRTLDRFTGNRTHAARELGISIRTLRNKLREYRQLAEGRAGGDAETTPIAPADVEP